MNSCLENPGLCHIGKKIFLSLDFLIQVKCRQVCRMWNQMIEDLFSKMIPKISWTQLNFLLNQFLDRIAIPHFYTLRWKNFLNISYYQSLNTDDNNRLLKLYMRHFLSNQGNNFRGKYFIISPLQTFVFLGNTQMVKFIVQNEVEKIDNFGWTILHEAVVQGHAEIVKYLCQKSFFNFPQRLTYRRNNIKFYGLCARDYRCNTPLHLALKYGYFQMVEFITENVDEECILGHDRHGKNVIHTSAMNGYVDNLSMFCTIIEKEKNIFLKDFEGNTPLHLAAEFGHLDCIKFLMSFKLGWSLIKVRNKAFLNPIDLAKENGHSEIVDYFFEFIYQHNKH